MNSAERATRLQLVEDDETVRQERELAHSRRLGPWRWRPVGVELQFRSRALPTLQLDLLRTEAADLMKALAKALHEKAPIVPRISRRDREAAARARGKWNKAHAIERAAALKSLVEQFSETGGW